ncbi:hypothetical protein C8R42DRAFT_446477 [Lentinula raphanica]|nr:hypothetical protein C8R42DRAFT_446477 [Lentinula raphanica]
MPQPTLVDTQHSYLELAQMLILTADALRDAASASDSSDSDDSSDSESSSDSDSESDTNDSDDSESDNERFGDKEAADLLELQAVLFVNLAMSLVGDGSRGPYFQLPKSKDFFECCLSAPDRIFRFIFRIGRPMFEYLVEILGTNPIFQSTGRKPQRHVKYQLAAFLIRYGTLGADVQGTALKLSIGYGSVVLYCRRMVRALRELKDIEDWIQELYREWGWLTDTVCCKAG